MEKWLILGFSTRLFKKKSQGEYQDPDSFVDLRDAPQIIKRKPLKEIFFWDHLFYFVFFP